MKKMKLSGGLIERARFSPDALGTGAPGGASLKRPASAPNLHTLVRQASVAQENANRLPADVLWKAASTGDVGGCRALLARGAASNRTLEWSDKRFGGGSPLHAACRRGFEEVAQVLLGAGADIEARNVGGLTCLGAAASMGHAALVGVLLGRGAAKGARSHLGCTPLWLASAYGHEDVVALLIEHKCDLEAKDVNRVSPLQAAAVREHTSIVRRLIAAGSKSKVVATPRPLRELPRAPRPAPALPRPNSQARLEDTRPSLMVPPPPPPPPAPVAREQLWTSGAIPRIVLEHIQKGELTLVKPYRPPPRARMWRPVPELPVAGREQMCVPRYF